MSKAQATYLAFRAKGFVPVPLQPRSKIPAVPKWQNFGELSEAEQRTAWAERPRANIGLLAGTRLSTGNSFGFVDIDDKRLVAFLRSILTPARCAKVGMKGQTIFCQIAPGVTSTKLRLKGTTKPAVEIFATSGMTVVPPSIHPDTNKPYCWEGKSLLQIEHSDLPVIDQSVSDIIRAVVGNKHVLDLIAAGPEVKAHDLMLRITSSGIAHLTEDLPWLADCLNALLPSGYEGNTHKETLEMLVSAKKKRLGAKRKHADSQESEGAAARLIGLACSRDIELFSDQNGKPFLSVANESGGVRTIALTSNEAAVWLRSEFFAQHGAAVPSQALSDALATLQAKAIFAGSKHTVSVRIARQDDSIFIDLGRDDFAIVAIDAAGWRLINTSPVKFRRPSGFGELPIPESGGSVSAIPRILNLEEEIWPLLLGFTLGCLRARGPYFCLLVDGEQGSGKSSLCAILKRILDPGRIENLPPPSSDEQLMIQAKDCHLLVIDNASGLRNDISDALCRLATGSALAKRKLYSDDDVHILTSCIPFIINGIGEFVHRPDLLERAIAVSLRSMPEASRKGIEQINRELERELPTILGSLYSAVSEALRNEGAVDAPTNIRMADAAAWLKAAEPATGLNEGALLSAIVESQERAVIDRIRENSLVLALEAVIANGAYAGRVGDLFDELRMRVDRPDRTFPRTAAHLSNHLQRLRPAMAKIGIFVELERRDREGRSVRIWRDGQNKFEPAAKRPWINW